MNIPVSTARWKRGVAVIAIRREGVYHPSVDLLTRAKRMKNKAAKHINVYCGEDEYEAIAAIRQRLILTAMEEGLPTPSTAHVVRLCIKAGVEAMGVDAKPADAGVERNGAVQAA